MKKILDIPHSSAYVATMTPPHHAPPRQRLALLPLGAGVSGRPSPHLFTGETICQAPTIPRAVPITFVARVAMFPPPTFSPWGDV